MAYNLALEHEMGYRFKEVAANSGSVKICMNAIRLRLSVKSFSFRSRQIRSLRLEKISGRIC